MAISTRQMTAEELLRNHPDGRCELIDGELITMTPAGYSHGRIAGKIFRLLSLHVDREMLGVICSAETGFIVSRNPDTVRAADAGFVRAERDDASIKGYFPGPPDLAVEVVSPDDNAHEVEAKTKQWLEAGVAMVWVIWPQTHSITVEQSGHDTCILHEGQTLDGGDVVPGLRCNVSEIFA